MTTLALILLTLAFEIKKTNPVRFIVVWGAAGTLAIWLSMPAIFTLTGVAFYYLYSSYICDKSKVRKLIIVFAIWYAQFLLFYFLFLRNESNSEYLLNWHKNYFFYLFPMSVQETKYNLDNIIAILGAVGGNTLLAVIFHVGLLVAGIVFLIKNNKGLLMLFTVPVICLFSAAGLHKFTLLPRVSLFSLPLLLILIAIGLDQTLVWLKPTGLKFVLIAIMIVCIINFNQYIYIFKPFYIEEFKQGLDIVQKEKISADALHINFLTVPVYDYYMNISPYNDKWKSLKGADRTFWNTDYDSLARTFKGKTGVLYDGSCADLLENDLIIDRRYFSDISVVPFTGGNVVILKK